MPDPDRMEKALRDIEAWAKAYPLRAFPEPNMKRVAEVLAINNITIDAVSASVIRSTLRGIECLVKDGLSE